ncbi:uncharacterized protein RP688-like [Tubulanus polymorphus]|uniref:uncharacterized protein RP688-like n=1 Tax=Tubulanus polymorphus TaxID=672921 RepID=UPI003DA3F30E
MTQSDHAVLLDLLDLLINICERMNITHFMYGGTLLGSWRHHGMVPWDDDIDIIANIRYKETLSRELQKLGPVYRVVQRKFQTKFMRNKGRIITPWQWTWPFIDFQYFIEDDTYIMDANPNFGDMKFLKSDIFPLHKRPFHGRMLNSPNKPLKYLHLTYGFSDQCQTHYWSHRIENFQEVVKTECSSLKHKFPFVHRRFINGIMEETLKLDGMKLQTYFVNEINESVTEPYSLRAMPPI